MVNVEQLLSDAVQHFWRTRSMQHERQGSVTGVKDAGNRAAVTGGKHADGFVRLVAEVVADAGIDNFNIHTAEKRKRTIPGYYRAAKEWDLVVAMNRTLVAAVEVKSQVGSFGNNFNSRVEEAIGNASDFWTAYAKGVYEGSARPWLGYFFMLEEHPNSLSPSRQLDLSPFKVEPAFQGLSYALRYEEVCKRLVRERLYDAACFITSNSRDGAKGQYSEPAAEIGVKNVARSLHAHVAAIAAV
jgi:hypothetical protein